MALERALALWPFTRWEPVGLQELTALARKFLKLDEAGRRSALVEAETLRAKLPGDVADQYLAVMRGVLSNGDAHVRNTIDELAAAANADLDNLRKSGGRKAMQRFLAKLRHRVQQAKKGKVE